MTSVRTNTALAGLGATAAWLTFVTDTAPAQVVVTGALVLLPGNAFVRRFPVGLGWRRRVLLLAAGAVVAATTGLVDHLAGHGPAATLTALLLLSSSLGLVRPAPRRVRRSVPAGDLQHRAGVAAPVVDAPAPVVDSPAAIATPGPVLDRVRGAS